MTGPAVPNRRPHWHAPEKGTGPAFLLSLFAHALLFLSIAFVVRWKTEPVGTVSAELWGGFPAATPAPAPAPVPVPEPAPPPPPPKVEPKPEPEPERKADIVMEQKKKPEPPKKAEPPKKIEPPKKAEPPKPDPKKLEAQRLEAQKLEAQKREAAKAAAEADKRREQELKRMAAAAGPPGSTGTATGGGGTGVSGGGLTDSYKGQIVGCIRPHIVFNVPDGVQPKQYVAEFEVQLLPTGEQATAPKLLKASGLASYDQAVERAIRRCDPFPRPKESAMPRTLRLTFDPVDTR